MTRLALLLLLLPLAACGPDTSAWRGRYTGSATWTAGRPPEPFTGTLEVFDSGQFIFSGTFAGATYAGALMAQTASATEVTFQLPATGEVSTTPADGCTRRATVNLATLNGDLPSIYGRFSGTLKTECSGGSTKTESFAVDYSGTRM